MQQGSTSRHVHRALLCIVLHTLAGIAAAAEFVAPYVNTVEEDVELMLDLASVGPDDYLIDLGAGDGRIVIAGARRGARGHGVELDPDLVALARRRADEAGVSDQVEFIEGDIFAADLSRATVVTAYLFPEANLQLRPKLLAELAPGTRVVSNAFHMGNWIPDAHVYGRTSGGAMLWIIPARVEGDWTFDLEGRRFRMAIEQQYQNLIVQLTEGSEHIEVLDITFSGRKFSLMANAAGQRLAFNGIAGDDRITGFALLESEDEFDSIEWVARRVGPGDLSP